MSFGGLLVLVFRVGRLIVLIRLQQVGCMEERALLQPDVHECGLDAGKHRLDLAQVDVAHYAAMVGPVDQEFDQAIVFEDGHARLALAAIDQDFAFHGGACPGTHRPSPKRDTDGWMHNEVGDRGCRNQARTGAASPPAGRNRFTRERLKIGNRGR